MAQPTQRDVHVDAILTNVSVAFIQSQDHYVAHKVFPQVPVDKQTDKYFRYGKNAWFRDEAQQRPDLTESVGSGYDLDTDTYDAEVFAFHKDIGDQLRNNADSPLNPDMDATRFVTNMLLLRQEARWVNDYFVAGKWATDFTPTNLWSDYTTGEPKNDIKVAKKTILSTTGFEPNTLVVGYEVWQALEDHPDIVDRIKYTSADAVTEAMVARYFGVERVLVAKSIRATNLEGETEAYEFSHGKHALLCYSNPTPSLLQPSAGYQFVWRGVSQGLGQNVGITRFRMQHVKGDRVEGEIAWDNKLVAADLGYFFDGAVS